MNLKRFIGKLGRALDVVNLKARVSYAQLGEDIIIEGLFASLDLDKITYLDIGANQPVICNNTYLFYKKGHRGVCIEPDIAMCEIAKLKRPGDVILNIGIGLTDENEATFYLFPAHLNTWSTFSEEEANIREKEAGVKSERKIVPLKNINNIIAEHFESCPNFVSIDVEGLDLDILKSLDFNRFKPDVFCVETISFSTNNTENKINDISDFLVSKGYIAYADTHINTIFCNGALFAKQV